MPIPFLLAGLSVAAGLVGAGAHLSAKETNEKAQAISEDAKRIYDEAKQSLEISQSKTEKSLLKLGYSKKEVLETSIAQFLRAYKRVMHIKFGESQGLDEMSKLTFGQQDAIQLREMSDIYQSAFASGATGAATGAVIALAASGALPVVTGSLSLAGSALMAGQIGLATSAAGLAGSALSFGATMTPLAAIAAPVVLFTGISSSIKADENLEKANTMYAEAEVAVEKMKTSETLCGAISRKADMFDNLLGELNIMFSKCAALLDGVTTKKQGIFKNKVISEKDLTVEEIQLLAVTRALAGAVKAVIDTPILNENGDISAEATEAYDNTAKMLPALAKSVQVVEQTKFSAKAIQAKQKHTETSGSSSLTIPEAIRNIFALIMGFFVSMLFTTTNTDTFLKSAMIFSVVSLAIIKNDTNSKFFKFIYKCLCLSLLAEFILLFYRICPLMVLVDHYIIKTLLTGIVSFIIFAFSFPSDSQKSGSLKKTFFRVSGCVFFGAVGILIYAFIAEFLGLNFAIIRILLALVYAYFAGCSVYIVSA